MSTEHRHFRHIEAPIGSGTLHRGGQLLATVTYGLRVLQEIIGTRHWSGASAVQGTRKITGKFAVIGGSLPFEGDQLTLRLEDGRSLALQVIGDGPNYTIESTGGFR